MLSVSVILLRELRICDDSVRDGARVSILVLDVEIFSLSIISSGRA